MTMPLLTEQQRFEMAGQIADAASSMDWLKRIVNFTKADYRITQEDHDALVVEIKNLHDIAALLAGSRVNEIYAPDDGSAAEETTHL